MITALFVLAIVMISVLILGVFFTWKWDNEEAILLAAIIDIPVAFALGVCCIVNFFL